MSGASILARAAEIARGRATPFYLFDADAARASARAWGALAAGPAPLDAFYPYKCNRHPGLREIVAAAGLGAEATVAADLEAALAALPGDRVMLQGAAPPGAALDRAVAAGAVVAVDGPEDAESLLVRARALGRRPRYLLRLRPSTVSAEQAAFGMPAREAVALARRLLRDRRPPPEGISFHLGTRIAAAAPFVAALREAADAARALAALGIATRVVDVGGGFPAGRGIAPGRAIEIAARLRREAARILPGARLLAEPGRAIAAGAFHLVARVSGVRGRAVRLDASRLSHAYFVPRGRHEFLVRPQRAAGSPPSRICGLLPVGMDVFSEGERVGRPRAGDLVVIRGVGAYNLAAANEWAGALPDVVEL